MLSTPTKIVTSLTGALVVMFIGLLCWINFGYPTQSPDDSSSNSNETVLTNNTNTTINTNVDNTSRDQPTAVDTTTKTKTNATDTNTTDDSTTTDNSDFNSCSVESTTLCNGLKDGKLALVDCLLNDHYNELSDACRNSLERRQVLNEALVAACATDRGTYCRGVTPQPGSEPMVDCLEEHYTQLSADCAAAFDAHAAAKPTQ